MYFVSQIIDFFFPKICIVCNTFLTENEKFICFECYNSISKVNKILLKEEFKRKFEHEKIISDFSSLYLFEKEKALQKLIHELKYSGNFKIGIFLGELIGKELERVLSKWEADLIIPVPLHKLKKAERGYNQSFYISKGLSKIIRIPVYCNVLKRVRNTPSQTELNLEERKENIRDAFKVKKSKLIKDKKVIIVDDVITTGATVSECGKELLKNGSIKVYALSVALAQ